MRWPYRCEVEVLAEVKLSRAEDKKGCGMVEEDRCVIEGTMDGPWNRLFPCHTVVF